MRKKLTIAALSSVFVFGMAASAMAIHETAPAEPGPVVSMGEKVTIDGQVRMRGYINKANDSKDSSAQTGYDTKVKLGVNAQVAPGAIGYLQLETNSDSADTYGWGNSSAAGLHTGGQKIGQMDILQAWVNYQPGSVGVKVGHMPLALGNKVFFDHTGSGDDAIVGYTTMGNTHMAALTIKFDEQTTSDASDDLDGYVALITHKASDNLTLGANLTHLVGGDAGSGELAEGMAMSNLGLTTDFKTGNISLTGDLEWQFGDYSDDGTTTTDAAGYAIRVGGTMDLGGATVGLLYGMGTGDDNAADNDNDIFVNFLTDTSYDTIIANYRASVPGTFTTYSGLSNLTLYQVNGTTSFTCPISGKNVSVKGAVSYMTLTEDTTNYGTHKEDEVGTEVDLVATWDLASGLAYKVEAAWLASGDVWMDSAGDDPDDLYFLRHSLDLTF
jgi:hypothetical protein